ncbi:MAG: 3-keto-5-aminohexanoate cleavage protein [Dehalococcoidia bacterium]|nr:3-keto-5-aminohexanoate cleavage protein [Dehalococcoidia bacterium]
MISTNKLVVCVAPTSNFHGKEANPALPYHPDEIAEEVYKCWNEGASIVHIHARDKDGLPTNDPDVFREIDQKIRAKGCDIILQHSTAPALRVQDLMAGAKIDVWEGAKTMEPKPEMASLNVGLGAVLYKGLEMLIPWTRSFIETNAKKMLDMGIKPEIEVYNTGMMEDVYNLIEKGLLTKPYWLSFVMGMNRVNQGAVRYTPKLLANYVDMLPDGAMFSTLGIMETEIQACTLAILLGGHVRVGFEDNINYLKGQKARDNAQLVSRIVMFGRELGREIASPAEARELLGIPSLKM